MRIYDFDVFRYICGLHYVLSSHVYVISLFTCVNIFDESSLSYNESIVSQTKLHF
jgi:hypothetical protein